MIKPNDEGSTRRLPATDPDRWEHLVRGIVQRGEPELERRRRAQSGLLVVLGEWRRPALPLASSLAAALLAGLLLVDVAVSDPAPEDETLFEALLPTPVAAWLVDDYEMEPIELVVALDEVGR